MKRTGDFRQRAIRVLLNNDTIVCKNSIYNMQRALTEEKTGAVGACSNSVGARQRIDESFQTIEEYIQYAEQNNVYDPFRHQKRLRLIGFALLIKRDLWDDIGGLDEVYGLGNFEDDDICLNILNVFVRMPLSFILAELLLSFITRKTAVMHMMICYSTTGIFLKRSGESGGGIFHIREMKLWN